MVGLVEGVSTFAPIRVIWLVFSSEAVGDTDEVSIRRARGHSSQPF